MDRNFVLKAVNALLFLSFLVTALTGIFLLYNFFASQSALLYWLHAYVGMAACALAVIHLILNWNWVRAVFFCKR